MNEKNFKTVKRLGLVSATSKAKWRELTRAVMSLKGFQPLACEKSIHETEHKAVFGFYDWECLRLGSSSRIEWLDIDPIERIDRGRLVSKELIDHSEEICEIFEKYSIHYSVEGKIFRVWGYFTSK